MKNIDGYTILQAYKEQGGANGNIKSRDGMTVWKEYYLTKWKI